MERNRMGGGHHLHRLGGVAVAAPASEPALVHSDVRGVADPRHHPRPVHRVAVRVEVGLRALLHGPHDLARLRPPVEPVLVEHRPPLRTHR